MPDPPPQIAVHSLSNLKNTTDDALPAYLTSLKFTQSHRLTDVRLFLSFTAFATAAVTFILDYKFGFESQKTFTTYAVFAYFVINTALTYWIWGIEKGKVYEGTAPNGTKLSLASYTEKHNPTYCLRVHTQKPQSQDVYTFHISAPFSAWFSADSHGMGELVPGPLQKWLASEIPLIGELGADAGAKGGANVKDSGSATGATTPSQGTRAKSRKK
ncbi:MAG: hypothetical protein M1840_003906 [Geoglossum simile]|nr:MAG: hypothetical protein M1840_003906 [Geoglossum simile]